VTLDGGGIRGLSELIILEELMERIRWIKKLPKAPRPADYFDLIGGTSTGGYVWPRPDLVCVLVSEFVSVLSLSFSDGCASLQLRLLRFTRI
jgi:Patatin-like phospholipase